MFISRRTRPASTGFNSVTALAIHFNENPAILTIPNAFLERTAGPNMQVTAGFPHDLPTRGSSNWMKMPAASPNLCAAWLRPDLLHRPPQSTCGRTAFAV